MQTMAIGLNAGNDTNGNPRRVWVVLQIDGDSQHIIDAVDEGYQGFHRVKEFYQDCIQGPMFRTVPAEYRALLKAYRASTR